MKINPHHPWPQTTAEAILIQQELRSQVITQDCLESVQYVAGIDLGYDLAQEMTRVAVVVLTFPDLQLHEKVLIQRPTTFPYVPGFLSFREVPAAIAALERLKTTPDLILCDGQGLAHPRRFGLACHLGVLTDIPTIGVAKSRLVGEHQELPAERGSWKLLHHKGEIVGAVLRTRSQVKPVYVSIGHRICLETAIDYVLRCTPKYRLPETTRLADRLAAEPVDPHA
jgi:deoxyribonuclease V